jgi:hypothetical protein
LIGQDTTISRKNIIGIFQDNAQGTTFDWKKKDWGDGSNSMHHSMYNCWTTCNADSIYYTSDTLIFYNHQYYYFNLGCGWYKKWCFDSKKQVSIIDSKPPMGIVGLPNTFSIIEKDSKFFIEIYENKEVIDKFLIIALNMTYQDKEKKEKCYKLTLKRIKTGYNKK